MAQPGGRERDVRDVAPLSACFFNSLLRNFDVHRFGSSKLLTISGGRKKMLDLFSGLNPQTKKPARTVGVLLEKLWMRFKITVDLDDAAAKGCADGPFYGGKDNSRDGIARLYGAARLGKLNARDLGIITRIIRGKTHHGAPAIHSNPFVTLCVFSVLRHVHGYDVSQRCGPS